MRLKNCSRCNQPILIASTQCPGCELSSTSKISRSSMALLMGFALGACTGAADEDTGSKDSVDTSATDSATDTDTGEYYQETGMMAAYGIPEYDQDGDGFFYDFEDCDDNDPNTHPGAAENDSIEECMTDADGDGYGSDQPSQNVAPGTDCNDEDETIHPNAEEIPGDGKDSNCDGNDDT